MRAGAVFILLAKMRETDANRQRVLVLDHDSHLAEAAASALSCLGYYAQSETCPAKSIRYILGGEYDILLTDYRMPGLDGLQVAYLLRSMGSMIPVILHTGERGDLCSEDLAMFGILGVIQKPLSMKEFSMVFTDILLTTDN